MSQPNSSDAQLGLFASVKPHYILVQYESATIHPYYGTPCRWQNMLDATDQGEGRDRYAGMREGGAMPMICVTCGDSLSECVEQGYQPCKSGKHPQLRAEPQRVCPHRWPSFTDVPEWL